jgi:hypothetical protein
MNYRDFFKKNKTGKITLPEGVDLNTLKKGILFETKNTKDLGFAAKLALEHLSDDAKYYSKISENFGEDEAELEKEPEVEEPTVDGEEDLSPEDSGGSGEEIEVDADSEEGMPKVGGALAIPHVGQPIHMSKIIQVGGTSTGQSASGDLSGYSSVNKDSQDKGGIPVSSDGDKETITAGGKKIDSSIASKSVGGEIVSGEGQKQGGPNTKGSIAGTPKMKGLTEAIKESIRFDKATGKWVLKEGIKKGQKVVAKMGASYKVVQPTQCKDVNQDTARTNQYEPEISENMDEEKIEEMTSRYTELVAAQRNLKESELAEMNKLKSKLDEIEANGTSYKIVAPRQARIQSDDQARAIQSQPDMTENEEELNLTQDTTSGLPNTEKALADLKNFRVQSPTLAAQRRAIGGGRLAPPEAVGQKIGADLYNAKRADLDKIRNDIAAKNRKGVSDEERFDNTPYRGPQLDSPEGEPEDLSHLNPRGEKLTDDEPVDEAGGAAVQHKSFRTANDNPQLPKNRHEGDIDENTEIKKSDTVKKIEKSNKTKDSKPLGDLKFKANSKTKSGIVKQKK